MTLDFINPFYIDDYQLFSYKELKIKHFKVIQKCLFGDEPNIPTLLINFDNVIKDIIQLPNCDIKKIDFFIYIIFLLELRCTCMGNIIFAAFTDKPDTQIEINVYRVINTLKEFYIANKLQPDTYENIKINYRFPTFNNVLTFTDKNFYESFIEQIYINDTDIEFDKFNETEKHLIVNKLPSKVSTLIMNKVQQFLLVLNNVNLAKSIPGLQDKELYFNFNIINILYLLKLTFGDYLFNLYDNIFYLSKQCNLDANYIENLTPGEYIIFSKKLQELNSKNTNTNKNVLTNSVSNNFSDGFE
jgi:hypothetical protein